MATRNERNLDLLLAGRPAGARIELDGGHYVTAGRDISNLGDDLGIVPRSGWRVIGHGSTIHLEPQRRPQGPKVDALYGVFLSRYGEDVRDFSIGDLTFDMGYRPGARHACSAVGLLGENMEVNRCRAIHWGNGSARAETFLFSLGAAYRRGGSLVPRNVIRDCRCEDPSGPYSRHNVTCYIIGGGVDGAGNVAETEYGLITGCLADGGDPDNLVVGYSMTMVRSGLVLNNRAVNLRIAGPYHDTWRLRGSLSVVGNRIGNCRVGMSWNLGGEEHGETVDSLMVRDNEIELAPKPGDGSKGIRVFRAAGERRTPLVQSAAITRNRIATRGAAHRGPRRFSLTGIEMDSVHFLALLDNVIDFGGANDTPDVLVRDCRVVTGRNQTYYDADSGRHLRL